MEAGTGEEQRPQGAMEKLESGREGEPAVQYRGWKAMPYVIGNETFEKLGTIGTTSNLLVYLTTMYHIKSVDAATLLNIFNGTTNLAPVLGAFLSDTYFGRYTTLAFATIASFLGMLILTLTAAVPSLRPPACGGTATASGDAPCRGPRPWQLAVLFSAFAFLVVGAGGIRPCNLAFGADQFDPRTASGRRGIASFFNWYYFTFTIAMMLSATLIIYLQSNVSWALGLAVPAALMCASAAVFFMGTRLYVRVGPEGSPFTSFAQVFVAAFRKRSLAAAAPEVFDPPHRSKLVSKIAYTDQFRCLDKAAFLTPEDGIEPDGTAANPWRLCTQQQVEEVKCVVRILPLWSSGILYYIAIIQQSTYVVLQALQSDRRLGASGFQVPAGSLVVFPMLAMTVWLPVYDRLVAPWVGRLTRHEGGLALLHRMGVGILISILAMVASVLVEQRRRRLAAGGAVSSMSCLWFAPQLLLAGLSEAFNVVGQVEFYYKQFPESMRSAAGALLFLGFAVANYASGFMVTAVHRATGGPGRPDWLAQDLNQGRVDRFYLLIAAIGVANFCYFVACAKWYRFKKADGAPLEVALEENESKVASI